MRQLPNTLLRLTVALASVGLLGAVRAGAQTVPSPYRFIEERSEVSVFVGTLNGERGPLRLGPSGGTVVGARYGFRITRSLTVEAAGFLASGDREVHDPDGSSGADLLGTVDSKVGGVDARVRVTLTGDRTWRGLAPFVFGGAGLAGDLTSSTGLESALDSGERFLFGPAPLFSFGAGSSWYPSQALGVRVEGVFHLWRIPTPRGFLDNPSQQDDKRWVQAVGVTAGVLLGF